MVGTGNDYNNQYNGSRVLNSYHERERSSDSKTNQHSSVFNSNGILPTSNNVNSTMNTTSISTNLNNNNANSNSNPINKLKLLKKRNALKKTLSNANAIQTSTQHIQASSPSNRSQNFENLVNSSSKEDFRSQTSLNNTNLNSNVISNLASSANRPLSMHLSRNSLNNIENSLTLGSNQQLMHKSSETIDEIILRDAKNKENSNANSFNRVRSVSRLNMANIANNPEPVRTKSENELSRKPSNTITNTFSNKLRNKSEFDNDQENFDFDTVNNTNANANKFSATINKALAANSNYLNNRVKSSIPTNNRRENNSPIHHRSSTRLDNTNNNTNNNSINNTTALQRNLKTNGITNRNTSLLVKNSLNVNNTKAKTTKDKIVTYQSNYDDHNDNYDRDEEIQKDFRIVYPGHTADIIKVNYNTINPGDTGYLDLFEPNPYNIMSDPVISEQFRKLYEEDEYFQQVHRKCCEWLNKYVFPEMEKEKTIQNEISYQNRRVNS